MRRSLLQRPTLIAACVCIVILFQVPGVAQQPTSPRTEQQSLLQLGAIVYRRITMLARRVQRDLRDARRGAASNRARCLNDVLSDLHSTQRAVDAWSGEIQRVEQVTPRLRGMVKIFREHLKDLRHEAVWCIQGAP